MITINLSEQQARIMLAAFGWRDDDGIQATVKIPDTVAREVFNQLEHAFVPVGTDQAETAAWFGENGYRDQQVENWKRKNETAEEAGL
ncbi:hypothetical protein JLBYU41_28 [Escherichia phage JLBYU41]|uniref:Uncharacterized protein n=1 Tax=Escherichia phage JLBYU41 TaxID=2894750 RepID=A0AAE9CFV0_9CAUD|nr:hypothetical protein JLBYU41_28 [Escherichia phage JLBYU41]